MLSQDSQIHLQFSWHHRKSCVVPIWFPFSVISWGVGMLKLISFIGFLTLKNCTIPCLVNGVTDRKSSAHSIFFSTSIFPKPFTSIKSLLFSLRSLKRFRVWFTKFSRSVSVITPSAWKLDDDSAWLAVSQNNLDYDIGNKCFIINRRFFFLKKS